MGKEGWQLSTLDKPSRRKSEKYMIRSWIMSMIQGADAISEETCGKAGDDERTTGRSAGRDESGNL
jgi:hypothetical protein